MVMSLTWPWAWERSSHLSRESGHFTGEVQAEEIGSGVRGHTPGSAEAGMAPASLLAPGVGWRRAEGQPLTAADVQGRWCSMVPLGRSPVCSQVHTVEAAWAPEHHREPDLFPNGILCQTLPPLFWVGINPLGFPSGALLNARAYSHLKLCCVQLQVAWL